MKNIILLLGESEGIASRINKPLPQDGNICTTSYMNENPDSTNVNHLTFKVHADEQNLSILPEEFNGFVYSPAVEVTLASKYKVR